MARQCDAVYVRPATTGVSEGDTVQCTYVFQHPTPRHSWESLKAQDEADVVAAMARRQVQHLPDDVKAILRAIQDGQADAYLEAILTVAHNRKRSLRGVRGFPELDL